MGTLRQLVQNVQDAVCVGLGYTWRKDHIGLINSGSETRRNGSSICIDVVRIQRQGSGMDGEEYWTILAWIGRMCWVYRCLLQIFRKYYHKSKFA